MFNIIEKFLSIDGEGPTAGELATFIRFQGCNLRCSWCDTKYSWSKNDITEKLSSDEIYNYIKSNRVSNVTLTGGEPLIQENIEELLEILSNDDELTVHIETNGAINISNFKEAIKGDNISYIVDFKLPSSNMTEKMDMENLNLVSKNDVYKFVVGSKEDLQKAYEIITEYDLTSKCLVYLSPVFGSIDMEYIVEFMKEKNMNKVRLQVQLHKIIWDKDKKGV
ncbi:putative 7-carboxy-7-deazaguanine synthase QueE [Clostridium sp. SM-530-WT-3G]|uniref:putative 7-carboxy-7-deazaguanine synthase QueE n=1 Tax=Clostridium sp. SM-530-WT-3G TaxID=2725303 RepID=UPI00145E964A|nr:putative 7-carboxy-7-deazaguanine synthase QueE [Clostridium sp. SM-530-WT-3G]NME83382.1 putative 7-carboxy-7-deazaguanine synthase QueE [Clostridium sp. SM-530-WT-3G]